MGLFGKDRPEPTELAPRGAAAENRAAVEPSTTVLGKGCRFEGRLSGADDVLILGHFKGEIDLKSDLNVGQGGTVEADIKSRNTLISGKVVGKVSAQHKVEIDPRGTLLGSIQAPKLVVAEGAQFKGDVDMSSAQNAPRSESVRSERGPAQQGLREQGNLKPAKT